MLTGAGAQVLNCPACSPDVSATNNMHLETKYDKEPGLLSSYNNRTTLILQTFSNCSLQFPDMATLLLKEEGRGRACLWGTLGQSEISWELLRELSTKEQERAGERREREDIEESTWPRCLQISSSSYYLLRESKRRTTGKWVTRSSLLVQG